MGSEMCIRDRYDFAPNPAVADYPNGSEAHALSQAFAANYTALLAMLHDVFNGAPETYFSTLSAMHELTVLATALMQTPDPRPDLPRKGMVLGPTWEYVRDASRFDARGGKARPISPAPRPPGARPQGFRPPLRQVA